MLAATTDPATQLPPLGSIALTAGLGMAALYILLPRPQAYPRWLGALLGALALVASAFLIVRATRAGVEAVLFYAFSALALVAGGVMITRRNAARAALSFAVVVLSTCGLFLLQAAPFLMASTVIVYAGAIIVTFLFVIMLAQPEGFSDADARSREPLLATVAGFFLLSTLLVVLARSYGTDDYDAVLARVRLARQQASPEAALDVLGDDFAFREDAKALFRRTFGESSATWKKLDAILSQYDDIPTRRRKVQTPEGGERTQAVPDPARLNEWLDRLAAAGAEARAEAGRSVGRLHPPPNTLLSPFAGTPANQPPQPLSAENVAGLGRALFTDYLLAVELGGTLLLVATVGAIAIAHRRVAARRTA
jgi:NADH:ubiquinone oxidoreductase subunit 6 (subunit J)